MPDTAGTTPGFSGSGSSIKIDGNLRLKGKLKNVVDGAGVRDTTGALDPGDDYRVEVDLDVPETGQFGTVTVFFDVTNGNAKFSADLSTHPVLAGAVIGDAVWVKEVRVFSSDTDLGKSGVAVRWRA